MFEPLQLELGETGEIVAAVGPFHDLLKQSAATTIGHSILDLVNPNDWARLHGIVHPGKVLAVANGVAVRIMDSAHRSIWVEFSIEHATSTNKSSAYHVTMLPYSTNLATADMRILDVRTHQTIVQQSADVVMVVDPDGTIRFTNPAMSKLFGRELEEIEGTQVLEMVHESDHDALTNAIAYLLEDPATPQRVEFRVRHRDGSYRWIDGWVQNHLDYPEIGALLGTGRDVTERHRAEEALAASEERFRSLTASSPSAIFELDNDARVCFANDRWVEVTGRSHQEVDDVFDVLLAEDANTLRALWRSDFRLDGLDEKVRVVRRDGSLRWVELRTRPVHDTEGDVTTHVGTLHDVTDVEMAHRKLEHLASHDTLTGLPNRALLRDRLRDAVASAKKHGNSLALLFVDLDHFKVVNDSLGHHAGDQVLVAVADRLSELVRPDDVVARFGGDEFVILCAPVTSADQTVNLADRIRQLVSGGVEIDGEQVHVSVSVGVVMGDGSTSPEAMLRDADSAMYAAKNEGRDRARVFDDEMHRSAMERLTIESGLRQARDRAEFHLSFQPIVDVNTRIVSGIEVLLRWNHPTRGVLGPDEFMDIAEETGLLGDLGTWVLDEACTVAATWAEIVENPPDLFVNLAAAQLVDPRLVEAVKAVISSTSISPSKVVLEVTERMLMTSPEQIAAKLGALRDLGVRIAIDDFGTGYSSLSHLTRLPVDVLKIDQSFVAGLKISAADHQVTAAVIALARALGLQTVAEGVEHPDQGETLKELGCDLVQGFYYAEPVSAVEVAKILDATLPVVS